MKNQSRSRRRSISKTPAAAAQVSECLEERQLLSAAQPQLLSPNTSVNTAQPTFTWTEVNAAVRYEIWVARAGTSSSAVLYHSGLTGNSATFDRSLSDGTYNWWLRAWDAAGNNSGWSSAQQFSVVTAAQQQLTAKPELLSPTSVMTGQPRFVWSDVAGAARYELWVAAEGSSQPIIHETSLTGTSASFVANFRHGRYVWWMRAWDASGNTTGWTNGQRFSVGTAAARQLTGKPELLTPIGTVTGQPQFEWSAVTGAASYEIWVSREGGSQPIIHETGVTGTSATFSTVLPEGNYKWWMRAHNDAGSTTGWTTGQEFTLQSTTQDDDLEHNDQISDAVPLGELTTRTTVDNLVLADSEDWFSFVMTGTGTDSSYVAVEFSHDLGDVDLALYDHNGRRLGRSTTLDDREAISLDGLAAGEYFIQVYGYQGATNPSYHLEVSPDTETTAGNSLYHTLHLNFDGFSFSYEELQRLSQGQWLLDSLDEEHDGIHVEPYQISNADREEVVADVMNLVQQQLEPYNITVRRVTGGPVEGAGSTTVYIGVSDIRSTVEGSTGKASAVDWGNDNWTDIAFVQSDKHFNWGSNTMQDHVHMLTHTILHEAGHTWGLHHVFAFDEASRTLYNDAMGMLYSAGQIEYRFDEIPLSEFRDVTFYELVKDGVGHGRDTIAGNDTQNSHQVMAATFLGENAGAAGSSTVLTDLTSDGAFLVRGSMAADRIVVRHVGEGTVLIDINGEQHILRGGPDAVYIYTNGDSNDSIVVDESLQHLVTVLTGLSDFSDGQAKVSAAAAGHRNRSELSEQAADHDHEYEHHDDEHSGAKIMADSHDVDENQHSSHTSIAVEKRAGLFDREEQLNNTADRLTASRGTTDAKLSARSRSDRTDCARDNVKAADELDAVFAAMAHTGVDADLTRSEIASSLLDAIRVG